MSAHNAIDDILIALADIDAKIWQCRRALLDRVDDPHLARQLTALLEEREAFLRKLEGKP